MPRSQSHRAAFIRLLGVGSYITLQRQNVTGLHLFSWQSHRSYFRSETWYPPLTTRHLFQLEVFGVSVEKECRCSWLHRSPPVTSLIDSIFDSSFFVWFDCMYWFCIVCLSAFVSAVCFQNSVCFLSRSHTVAASLDVEEAVHVAFTRP